MISPATNPSPKQPSAADQPSPFFQAAQVSSVGMEMAVATLVGWGAGYWLDNHFETGPWLMLLGLLFGVAAGFKGLIRTANSVNARTERLASLREESK